MPDTKFLERLHDDPPAAQFDALPEELRASYRELLGACAAVRAETSSPYALERTRRRLGVVPRAARAAAPRADFGEELRAMLRRAPWYGTSLVIHLLALFVFDLVAFSQRRAFDEPILTAVHDLTPPAVAETRQPKVKSEDLEPPEVPEERLFEEDTPEAEEDPVPERAPDPVDPRDLTIRIPALTLPGTPIEGEVDAAHQRARKVVEAGLGDGLRKARALARDRILVRKGRFDRIERVLEVYRIPHTVVQSLHKVRLRPGQILFINCGQMPVLFDPAPKLRAFVSAGGWVMTSDWALDPYLTGAFPGIARVVKPARRQRDVEVVAQAVAPRHPLLERVIDRKRKTLWWVEDESTHFRVDPRRVTVLVASEEMHRLYGQRVLAFLATEGRGRIVHVLGHFYQERGNMEGLTGMQRMILNFILMRLND